MPHQLFITDGTSTISLTTADVMLNHYVPQSPRRIGPGVLDYEPVSEEIEITIMGESTTAAQATINFIERLLVAAIHRHLSGIGKRVYLQYQPIDDETLWRAELRDGVLRLRDRAMTTFGQAVIEATISVVRVPWWEGDETALPLSNGNGSDNTSGLTIYNHDDAGSGHDNWGQIGADVVAGVLPTPVKLTLTNNTGASQNYRTFYLANNAFSTPGSFTHMIEGESATGGTVDTLAEASSGEFVYITVGTGELSFTLSSTLLAKCAGRYFRLIARFYVVASAGAYVTPLIRDTNGLIDLYEGDEVLLPTSGQLVDLGALPLPPGGYNDNWASQLLVLKLRSATSQQLSLDYLQLTPLDSYRVIKQRGYQVANGSLVVDDGIDGLTYLREGGKDEPIYTTYGQPLHIFPSSNPQRLIILHDEFSSSPPANTFSVTAVYRPRRVTI